SAGIQLIDNASANTTTIAGNIIGPLSSGAAGGGTSGITFNLLGSGAKVKLANNLIRGNVYGLFVATPGTPNLSGSANNCITGNSHGVGGSDTSETMAFAKNWWGAADGPSGLGGSGDAVQ